MSKERLKEAKLMAEMLRVETRLPHDFPFDLVDWLVKQAELGVSQQEQFHDYQTQNLRLQKRVQELERERDEWRDTSQSYYMTNQELREQNKRYREVINKFFELEGSYKDIVNRAERMFIKVLDEIGE